MHASDELISVLTNIQQKITDDSDLTWISYETPKDLRKEIDRCIRHLQQKDISVLEDINLHFAPTGTFQEHSMANGWADEYRAWAARFDRLYESMKR